jgi:tRNA A-37 threonylcarbamoyl transferase component Bud32/tetratricopeptide (TPR) repeat protein
MSDRRSDTDLPHRRASARDDGSPRPSKARGALIAGRFVVERMLGRGGMATVYLAHDRLVDRPVALKILRRELANSVAMERFAREIGVIGRLRHAHIVPLHDSGIYDELPYYVMAYIEGESLQERMAREGALPIAEVVRYGGQVAEALDYAHREGVLHRDITPGNILLADGNAYVADFGIARLFTETTRVRTTESGFILGTPTYMSPEQASGELECDGRSDVYSLGCVLYEMVAGVPPFRGTTPQAIIAGRFGAPPAPVSELRHDVPSALSDAIARAMMIEPPDRFQSAAELGAAIAAASPPDSSRVRVRSRRSRARRVASVAVLLASAVLGAGYVAGTRWTPLRERVSRLAVQRAIDLVSAGEWGRADTAFRGVVRDDPANAQAHLWLAQTGALAATTAPDPSDGWKAEVALAEEGRARLDSAERLRLAALEAYAHGEHDTAREWYRQLVALDPAGVATRLALADAYLNDSVVVPDPASPSRWRFRGSYEAASRALLSALDLRPRAPAIRRAAFDRLSRVLITSSRYRPGRADSGDVRAFAGFPSLAGDTLAFVPYSLPDVASGVAESRNTTLSEAQSRNRETLRRVAEAWVEDLPDDADAHRAYATALAATGVLDAARPGAPDAVREIRLARQLARDDRARLLTGAQEVRLLVRARRTAEARALADSLIAGGRPRETDEIRALAALATLTGNAPRAVAFMTMTAATGRVRLADGRDFTLPPTLVPPWLALEVYGALGQPADSVRALRDRLSALVRRDVAPTMAGVVRASLLTRPLTLAAPSAGAQLLADVDPGGNLIARLVHDVAVHDTAALRAGLRSVDTLRRWRDAASLSIDGAYLFSWLRLVAGDTAGAERQMDTMLEQLRALTDGSPTDMVAAALVVRLMRQRAAVAERRAQPAVATRWRAAADTLWRGTPRP